MIKDQWLKKGLVLGFVGMAGAACSNAEPTEDQTDETEQAVVSSCTKPVISVSPSGTASYGSPINVTVTNSVTCPASVAPAFQLYVKNAQINGGSFVAVGGQQASGSFSYDTNTGIAGNNTFEVAVRKTGSTEAQAFSDPTVVNVIDNVPACTTTRVASPANNTTLQASTVQFTATATGCPNPEFEYWFKSTSTQNYTIVPNNPGNPTGDQFITTAGTINFPAPGTYNVTVVARNVGAHLGVQGYNVRAANAITLTLTAPAQNHAPVANTDTVSAHRGQTITINALSNDTDQDQGDVLTITNVSAGTLGTATVAQGGGSISYTAGGTAGTETLTYTISDGHTTSQGSINVSIVNQAPVAIGGSYSLFRNGSVGDVVSNVCSDADGDETAAILDTQPQKGTVTQTSNPEAFSYQNNSLVGTDSVSYHCVDGFGTSSNSSTLTFTITNRAPVANDDNETTHHAGTFNDLLNNDTDADNDETFISAAGQPGHGSTTFTGGNVTYTANAGFTGQDSFTYTVSDGIDTSTATVHVTVGNTAPTATNDSYATSSGTTLNVGSGSGVLANDSDSDGDSLSAALATNPANGSLTFNSNGSFTYSPNAGFRGTDTFTYTANDGTASSEPATVSISVGNAAPVANNDSFAGSQNTQITGNVLTNDTDANNDQLTAVLTSGVSSGTLTLSPNGSFTYNPAAGFTGTDTFTYQANDGTASSNTATATITVNAVAAGCTVSIDTPPTATINQSFTLHATASCTTGTAQVEWLRKIPGAGSFAIAQAFTTVPGGASFTMTSTTLGTFQFEAVARTLGTTTPTTTSAPVSVAIQDTNPACTGGIRVTAPAAGTHIAVNQPTTVDGLVNTGTCSNGQTPEYQVWAKPNTSQNWIIFGTFSTNHPLNWSGPTSVGTWNVTVVARTVGNHSTAELRANSINVIVQ